MKTEHRLRCEAPICQDDNEPDSRDTVIWMPGEPVCKKYPPKKFQRMQREINRWVKEGRFKNMDGGYTANDLETRSI